MISSCELILSHGWGLSSLFWNSLIQKLPINFDCRCVDRGYFQTPSIEPVFSVKEGKKILISHSYGLHSLQREQIEIADYIIIFSGFISIHPKKEHAYKKSKKKIKLMMEHLHTVPLKLLEDVYTKSAFPQKNELEIPSNFDIKTLSDDLCDLSKSSLNLEPFQSIPNILILHGDMDKIVPVTKGIELQKKLPQAHLTVINGIGHFLPHTHSGWCAQEILFFLNEA